MKKSIRFISAIVATLSLGSLLTGASVSGKSEGVTVRVGTYNIDSKDNPDAKKMLEVFKENNIDIVGFQEIDMFNGRNNFDMMAGFKGEDYPYQNFVKNRDFADGYFGVGVVSKHKLLEEGSVPIENTGGKATKVCERVVIEKDGKKIALYNTHLSFESLALRRRQISQIIDIVNADPMEYKVITGDFNTDQNLYEYSMFLDNFNIANGQNGKWYETFNLIDPDMKVYIVDNIIATKNIRIKNPKMIDNKLSDHNLLFADLELLDNYEGKAYSGNLALGQEITASSSAEGYPAYELADYYENTEWRSGNSQKEQSITIELDKVYNINNIEINWGNNRARKYEVLGSLNGKDYEKIYEYDNSSNELKDEINIESDSYKFLKFSLLEKLNDSDKYYSIKEIRVFGSKVINKLNEQDMIKGGNFDNEENLSEWNLDINKGLEKDFKVNLDEAGIGDKSSVVCITKASEDKEGTAYLNQNSINVEENKTYKLSFWHKTYGLDSGSFGIDITQRDSEGNEVPQYHTILNDNVNINGKWNLFQCNIVTAPQTETIDLGFKITNGKGSLLLDDISLKETTLPDKITN